MIGAMNGAALAGVNQDFRLRYKTGLAEALIARIEPEPNSGCWLWTGYVGKSGHGFFTAKPHGTKPAHRLVFHVFRSVIAPDMVLDHLCRNPQCVNPNHLECVSSAENTSRWASTRERCNNGHDLLAVGTRLSSGRKMCCACWNEKNARVLEKARRKRLSLRSSVPMGMPHGG